MMRKTTMTISGMPDEGGRRRRKGRKDEVVFSVNGRCSQVSVLCKCHDSSFSSL
jgi:hypothetical protein